MENVEKSLVSLGILTYNSAKTVLETLDSAYAQTYKNIELIISDDSSKDDTVAICKSWIETHASRFVRCKLLTVDKNSGISANCNRLVSECKGEYVKYLAGDDIFYPSCIEDNMNHVGDSDLLISDLQRFRGDIVFRYNNPIDFEKFCKLSSKDRVHYYARTSFFCNVPTLFFKRILYNKVGMYDESEPMLEDVPFLLKVFASDAKVGYFPKVTIKYRDGGISNSGTISFHRILLHAFWNYRIKYLKRNSFLDQVLIIERKISGKVLNLSDKYPIALKLYTSRYNLIIRLLDYLLFGKCRSKKKKM